VTTFAAAKNGAGLILGRGYFFVRYSVFILTLNLKEQKSPSTLQAQHRAPVNMLLCKFCIGFPLTSSHIVAAPWTLKIINVAILDNLYTPDYRNSQK
jgi:hypothetical protein